MAGALLPVGTKLSVVSSGAFDPVLKPVIVSLLDALVNVFGDMLTREVSAEAIFHSMPVNADAGRSKFNIVLVVP